MSRRPTGERRRARARHLSGLALLVIGLLVPVAPLLIAAMSGQWRYPALVPQSFSARGFRLLLDPKSEVLRGLATSAGIAAAVALLASLVGLSAGRALGLYSFRGRRAVQLLFLAPVIVPGLAVALGVQVFFIRYHLADTIPGVILVQLLPTIPYVTLAMGAAFANFDTAYEDQARVLGAGPVRTFWSVTLPGVRPGLAVAAYFAFLISWSEYILTLLVGGGTVKTLPLLLLAYIGGADLNQAAALALVFVLPPILLLIPMTKYLTGNQRAAIGLGRL
ncbi:MAG: ABC transporter permease subunit [Actinomycetota bacterium]|nr:ABC transporter permease subunit [Actinomycetota bacterium]